MTELEQLNGIEPAKLSTGEVDFLLDNLGRPPIAVFRTPTPVGVNPAAVRPILQRVYDLLELEKETGEKWIGVEAVKAGLNVYKEDRARCSALAARVPRAQKSVALFPSMYSFDGKGKPHAGGPGSDSGGYQRTYFDPVTKQRKPLFIEFVPTGEDWVPPWLEGLKEAPKDLIEDAEKNRFECAICGQAETYRPDSSASRNAARARISKHMKTTEIEADLHREYHLNVFGS